MLKTKRCTPHTKMSDLISENYSMLLLIFRFSIPLGVAEKTVKEVCEENEVDVETFLMIVHFLLSKKSFAIEDLSKLRLTDVMKYLYSSHSYFLDFRLPAIRLALFSSIKSSTDDVRVVIQRFFDEYVEEVRKHMQYENKVVFPYVESLLSGKKDPKYSISIFKKRHDQVEMKIMELKNILIKYYIAPSNYQLNSVLYDLFACEKELMDHNQVEDFLFVPAIERLEKQLSDTPNV